MKNELPNEMKLKSGNETANETRNEMAAPPTDRSWALASRKHEQILELLRDGVSVPKTARIVGVGRQTVQRRKEIVDREIAEQIAAEDGRDVGEVVAFVRSRWKCPKHGWLEVRPCVICASVAARESAGPVAGPVVGMAARGTPQN